MWLCWSVLSFVSIVPCRWTVNEKRTWTVNEKITSTGNEKGTFIRPQCIKIMGEALIGALSTDSVLSVGNLVNSELVTGN